MCEQVEAATPAPMHRTDDRPIAVVVLTHDSPSARSTSDTDLFADRVADVAGDAVSPLGISAHRPPAPL
jgi:hypothetical protein